MNDNLLAQLDAAIELLRVVCARFARDDDNDALGVRQPSPRLGPSPRIDRIAALPPHPRYRLDVIGHRGCKVTIETLDPATEGVER